MSSNSVSAELALRLVMPEQTIVPLVASLRYSPQDPYAISIVFRVGFDDPVEWIFARDLLSTGFKRREGCGDVTVWQSADSEGSVLHIALSSPDGRAHFEAPVRAISDFLSRTYQLVPVGKESDHIDVEAGLDDLFRQAS